jgi:DNA-binding MurR/RpiR family transcriptional regulator
MTTSLAEKLRADFSQLTKSEKAVASYMLTHMNRMPYETAASIAESAGVSSMTVSRFLRNLGFNGLSDLKEHMRTDIDATPLLISDRLKRIRKAASRNEKLSDNLELEIQATLGVYELASGAVGRRVIEALAASSDVFVTGFQTISGIASDFAGRLDYIRPNVRFLDGKNGTFSELLAGGGGRPCLTLFEMRRYTKLSLRLAEAAREAGLPTIILCDSHCYWARDYSDMVLSVSTESHLFWDSQAPFLTLGNLLLDAVISRLGDSVEKRVRKMRALQECFDAFHG